jgi:hypothetical protein
MYSWMGVHAFGFIEILPSEVDNGQAELVGGGDCALDEVIWDEIYSSGTRPALYQIVFYLCPLTSKGRSRTSVHRLKLALADRNGFRRAGALA